MTPRRVLVTGCGRSGTTYTSVVLRRCGLHVPHEHRMGRDGIASWLFGVESTTVPWGPSPSEFRFDHVVHLVRDPLAAMPSMATFKPSAWDYIAGHVALDPSEPLLVRSATYWLHWNRLIEKRATLRLRVEELPEALPLLCARIGAPIDVATLRDIPRDLHTRRHGRIFASFESRFLRLGIIPTLPRKLLSRLSPPPSYENLTWQNLEALDPRLRDQLYEKASEYGYRYAAKPA